MREAYNSRNIRQYAVEQAGESSEVSSLHQANGTRPTGYQARPNLLHATCMSCLGTSGPQHTLTTIVGVCRMHTRWAMICASRPRGQIGALMRSKSVVCYRGNTDHCAQVHPNGTTSAPAATTTAPGGATEPDLGRLSSFPPIPLFSPTSSFSCGTR